MQQVVKLMKKKGTVIVPVESSGAGDIVSLCGLANPSIGHTVSSVEVLLFECFSLLSLVVLIQMF